MLHEPTFSFENGLFRWYIQILLKNKLINATRSQELEKYSKWCSILENQHYLYIFASIYFLLFF